MAASDLQPHRGGRGWEREPTGQGRSPNTARERSPPTIPWLLSTTRITLSDLLATSEKDGHPVPESNFLSVLKSVFPHTTHVNVPSSFTFRCGPVGRMICRLVTQRALYRHAESKSLHARLQHQFHASLSRPCGRSLTRACPLRALLLCDAVLLRRQSLPQLVFRERDLRFRCRGVRGHFCCLACFVSHGSR